MTKANNFDVRALGTRAGQDLEAVFSKFEPSQLEILSQELLAAKQVPASWVGANYEFRLWNVPQRRQVAVAKP